MTNWGDVDAVDNLREWLSTSEEGRESYDLEFIVEGVRRLFEELKAAEGRLAPFAEECMARRRRAAWVRERVYPVVVFLACQVPEDVPDDHEFATYNHVTIRAGDIRSAMHALK